MTVEADIAVLKDRMDRLEGKIDKLVDRQESVSNTLTTGKGMILAVAFILGSTALTVGDGIKRVFGL